MNLAAIKMVSGLPSQGTLPLEQTGSGTWKAIVDFQPAPSSAEGLSTKTEVKISAASETTRKGVCRLMLKVAIPYSALYASDVATGDSNLKFSANRSNGEVSAHVVLTLPKECVADIVQQKGGSVGRVAALAHAKLVTAILQSIALSGNGGSDIGLSTVDGQDWMASLIGTFTDLPYQLADEAGGTKAFMVSETGFASFETLVDRAARGYTPLADRETIGAVIKAN